MIPFWLCVYLLEILALTILVAISVRKGRKTDGHSR